MSESEAIARWREDPVAGLLLYQFLRPSQQL